MQSQLGWAGLWNFIRRTYNNNTMRDRLLPKYALLAPCFDPSPDEDPQNDLSEEWDQLMMVFWGFLVCTVSGPMDG